MAARARLLVFAILAALCTSAPAHAQSHQPRVRLSVSGGAQAPAGSIADRITFERDIETETIDVKYPKTPGVLVDVGLGLRIWKNLGLGFAVGHVTGNGTADVIASVPHKLYLNQPRTVTGKQTGIRHGETGLHLQVQYAIPASRRVRIVLGAGPSRLKLNQDVVTDVNVNETYPFDTAEFHSAVTKRSSASLTGYHAGIDVTWNVTRSLGFGGLVRYTRADATLDVRTGHSFAMKAGGAQGAAGVRFAF